MEERDIFCEIVKMSYGKGSKNPVSGPTAFYEPRKSAPSSATSAAAGDGAASGCAAEATEATEGDDEVVGEAEALWRKQEKELAEQNRLWSVGVVPQGEWWVY